MSGVDNANALGAGAGKIPDTASKVPQQLSISTKVTTFQDVQRSLEEVKAILEQYHPKHAKTPYFPHIKPIKTY